MGSGAYISLKLPQVTNGRNQRILAFWRYFKMYLEFCTNVLGKPKTPHEMFTRAHILTQNWQFLDTSLMSENGKSRDAVLLCESNSFWNTTIFYSNTNVRLNGGKTLSLYQLASRATCLQSSFVWSCKANEIFHFDSCSSPCLTTLSEWWDGTLD